ncbi:MAG: hypothetical protein EA392_04400 [Cryomorphaceae bacterium]|nr:MAG: hypothetical protein EA392_04400 [Cryomorphaceae bacterium]
MKRLLSVLALLALIACDNGGQQAQKETTPEESTDQPPVRKMPVHDDLYTLNLGVPEDYVEGNDWVVSMNESFGYLEVSSGDVYQLIILDTENEEPGLDAVVTRLESDLVFQLEIAERLDNALLFKQYIPGTDREFWHFVVVFKNQDQYYIVKDQPLVELNAYQSRKIFDALLHAANNWNDPTQS